MAMLSHPYPDLPLRPQLVRNAPLFTIFLEADQATVAALFPAELAPRPDGRIITLVPYLAQRVVGVRQRKLGRWQAVRSRRRHDAELTTATLKQTACPVGAAR
jgi:hypothetical protein